MNYNLERFISAQENTYIKALSELKRGRKETHWMWFIFPQIIGLGESSTSDYYAIKSINEAEEYLRHPVLGSRLMEVVNVLLSLDEDDPRNIFGGIDSLKLRSSMTLFYRASGNEIFLSVLKKFYDGEEDNKTIDMINLLSPKKKLSLLDELNKYC